MRIAIILAALVATPAAVANDYFLQSAQEGDCGSGEDAGGTFETALLVPRDADCPAGLLRAAGDSWDWFRFYAEAGEIVTFRILSDSRSQAFEARHHEPDGSGRSSIGYSVFFANYFGGTPITSQAKLTGEHRIAISARDDRPVSYRLVVAVTQPAAQDDCGSGRDATFNDPVPVALPAACAGDVVNAQADREDAYSFTVPPGATIVAASTGSACLYGPKGSVCEFRRPSSLRLDVPNGGAYKLAIVSGGSYTASVTLDETPLVPKNDCGTGVEAAETFDAATPLPVPAQDCEGDLGRVAGDSVDYFLLDVPPGKTISVDVASTAGSTGQVCFDDPSGVTVSCCSVSRDGSHVALDAKEGGAWRLHLGHEGGQASYRMSVRYVDPLDEALYTPLQGYVGVCWDEFYDSQTAGLV